MAYFLLLESSTSVCSVGVSQDYKLLALEEMFGVNSHSTHLAVCVEKVLKKANLQLSDLDAIALSMGPGSYTGLRIGSSLAKGFCFGLDIPLIAINTMESMAYHFKNKFDLNENELLIPLLDARRMEVYTQVFDYPLHAKTNVFPHILSSESFEEFSKDYPIVLFGDGAEKCKEILPKENIRYEDKFVISAAGMVKPAFKKFQEKQFEDIAYFEPFYLKEYVAAMPKVKGLT